MKIALLGTRGVPANYSGFETCAEQLGQRLVERGHSVTVYCRPHHVKYNEPEYKGMRLIKIPTWPNKYFDTICHALLSSIHALFQDFDIGLYFIAGNSPVTWIPRLAGTKTLLNVDGLDWKREKWPYLAKKYIQLAEYLATFLPNAFVTDSLVVRSYYQQRFKATPHYISYGSEVEITPAGDVLSSFGLEKEKYVLFVGRLVPENCVHHLVEAFRKIDTDFKCVVVGDAPYSENYKKELLALSANDPRIIFTGYQFGRAYQELGSNAYAFVETSGVGGTHPAVLEAMAFGTCVIVQNTAENLETIGEAGLSYDGKSGAEDLRRKLEECINDPQLTARMRDFGQERVRQFYTWEAVTDLYESLFYQLRKIPLPERLRDIPHLQFSLK